MTEPSDAELMIRTRSGDPDAFARLVDRHKDSLVNYLTKMTGSRDRAEEHAQEAFVRAFQQAAKYDERGKFAPWLFRIATNLVRSEAVRTKLRDVLLLRFGHSDGQQPSPDTEMQQREIQREVAAALASLPLACRAAVVLREVEGWSYQEIATSLGCSEGTVKSRIARGREELRRRLAPFCPGDFQRERRRAV